MRSVVKVLLVWVIALALPMQGLAASTMLFCAPQHHAPQAAAESHDHTAHARMGGDATTSHGDMHSGHDDGGATDDDSTCSVCAACCTAVAITVSVLQPAVLDISSHYGPAISDPRAGFMTAGLERPPRNILA